MRRKVRAVLVNNIKSRNIDFLYRSSKNYLLTYLSIIANRPLTGPMLAVISPTYRCNLRCEMCSFWKRKGEKELQKEVFFKVMNDLFDMKTPMISFSGGEPLLRADIFDLIGYACNKVAVHVASNGTLITREVAKKLCDLNVDGVSISLDAFSSGIHNKIRGINNSFQNTLEGLENLVAESVNARLSVDIVSVLSENNAEQIPRLLDLAHQIGIGAVGIIPIHRFNQQLYKDGGMGKEGIDRIEATLDHLIEVRKAGGIVDNSVRYLKEVKNYFRGGQKRSSCSAGLTTCVIDSLGYVYPCYGFYVMGNHIDNIKDKSLKDIWFSNKYNQLRKDLFNCRKCLWNCHGEFDVLFRSAIRIREMIGN